MFKINIWYDYTIVTNNVPYSVGIKCINCGKTICCLLKNKITENFITHFVSKIKPIDVDYFFEKKVIIIELRSSLNDDDLFFEKIIDLNRFYF